MVNNNLRCSGQPFLWEVDTFPVLGSTMSRTPHCGT
jgi:hypothetical protein